MSLPSVSSLSSLPTLSSVSSLSSFIASFSQILPLPLKSVRQVLAQIDSLSTDSVHSLRCKQEAMVSIITLTLAHKDGNGNNGELEGVSSYLVHKLTLQLVQLYMALGRVTEALGTVRPLIKLVRKREDKLMLVELYMWEAEAWLKSANAPKARAALTSARANAAAVYCPPAIQAKIDMQAGCLCAEEKDYKTGFSYFYECFEGYNALEQKIEAGKAFKYMLLCKIMTNNTSDVHALVNGKAGIKYVGRDVEAMKKLAEVHKERSIQSFQQVMSVFKDELEGDEVIKVHIKNLYDNLLEQNLLRIVEPFSRVQISHVAELIDLPLRVVQLKLSAMILDKILNGILDQGAGDLILFEPAPVDKTYEGALATIQELGVVIARLNARSQKIN